MRIEKDHDEGVTGTQLPAQTAMLPRKLSLGAAAKEDGYSWRHVIH